MIYTANFVAIKISICRRKNPDIFVAQNTYLTSVRNLSFRTKIRNKQYPVYLSFINIKMGVPMVKITQECYSDDLVHNVKTVHDLC